MQNYIFARLVIWNQHGDTSVLTPIKVIEVVIWHRRFIALTFPVCVVFWFVPIFGL
jgi:hypothetical protein